MARTAIGYFHDRAAVDSAYEDLTRNGFVRDDLSIIGRGREGGRGLADDDHVHAGEGAAVGGITGLLIGAAVMLIPGIGPVVAVGPLTAALTGIVTGGVTGVIVGGIAGALIDAGVPEDEARYYDERFRSGGYLLTVRTDDANYQRARDILARHGADMREPAAAATADTHRWDELMPRYRQRWQERYGTSGGRWEDYEPGYRYGWEMRNNPRYRGRAWADVEPDLRRDWETRYPDRPWDRMRDTIRDTWDNGETIELHEERLQPRKESVEAGQVAVRKDVVTEQKSMDVPVTHEEVYVERHPVTPRPAGAADFGSGREEVRVPVREEEVHLEKQPVVTEEVTVGKRTVQDTERVSDTVRKEVPRVERTGDVDVRGDEERLNRP